MTWEDRLQGWTKRASDNEDEKRERTEQQIRAALSQHSRLSKQPLRIYAKGSYPNNTNVRLDSDVDINVEYHGGFYYDLGPTDDQRLTKRLAAIQDYTGPYTSFSMLKDDVEDALVAAFGAAAKRENKCITVREKATTLPADVVPCWEYRWYYEDRQARAAFHQGTAFDPDSGGRRIVNYPQQHHDNGIGKNNRTNKRYKRTVRALKRLENEMVDKLVISEVPSYLIECLVHQCPDTNFSYDSYQRIVRQALASIYSGTDGAEPSPEADRWVEVNGIKFLFHPLQSWTRQQANSFALAAWKYMGLE